MTHVGEELALGAARRFGRLLGLAQLLPRLLAALQRNLDRGSREVRLFEIGRRYLADGELPTMVAVLETKPPAKPAINSPSRGPNQRKAT